MTPALLEFLEDTRVSRMPGRVLLAGAPDVNEDDLDEIVLWAPEEKETGSGEEIKEEDGPGPPL